MIVGDLHFESIVAPPHETDPVLIVDADTVLSGSITLKSLQPVCLIGGRLGTEEPDSAQSRRLLLCES